MSSKSAGVSAVASGASEIRHWPSTWTTSKSSTSVAPAGLRSITPLPSTTLSTSRFTRYSLSSSRGTGTASPRCTRVRASGCQVPASSGVRYSRATE